MKKVIFFLALFLTCSLLAVAQKGISYQAVILDPKPIEIPGQDITGQPFVNGAVSLKFKLFSSTFVQEFEEVHVAKTDAYGMVNVLIGSVSPAAFSSVVWDSNSKNLQVWVSFDQGGTYTKVSEQQLTYNPMALFAETASKLSETLSIAGGGTGATTAAGARTNLGLGNVDNTADAAKPISTATEAALDTKANADEVNTALATKANAAEVTTALATKANAAEVTSALATKANANEVTTALATKANASDVTTSLGLKEDVSNKANTPLGTSTSLYPTQNAVKTYVDAQIASATIADASSSTKGKIQLAGDLAGTAAAPTVPGLALKANASDVTTVLAVKADTAYVLTKVAAATIADASSSTKGKIQLAGDLAGTAAAPTVPGLALKADAADVTTALNTKASTSDLTSGLALKANTADMTAALALKAPLASPTFTGTVTTAAINTGALSSTAVTAPTYASAPRTLTYSGSTINWNPALGLNAAITLTQNSTLSFTAAPPVGSYGTVVLTQDGTGGRTLTLPTLQGATNQVLGSTSTSTVALSTAASSKDILNFYYDGTVVYWNIGQGYGAAASSGTTNLGTGVTGTLGVASGGTGATTLTGLVKGNGTGAMTAAVAGTDYLAPTGSAAGLTNFPTLNQNTTGNAATATLATSATSATSAATAGNITATSNTTLTSLANLTTVGTITSGTWSGTAIAVANGGTGATNAADARTNLGLVIGTNVQAPLVAGTDYLAPTGSAAGLTNFPTLNQNTTGNAANVTGTVAVANGGTGAATLTGYVKGTGTTAMTASATIPVADVTGAAPLASPTFTGAVTAPIYATTPQALTFGSPISWNPANGLNASVTLTGNGTLSFSSPPTAGAYGTLVVTQDGAGSRTLTLPTATNKVLGSAATTAIALSTAANAIDIVNFYYDGSNYFWNVGQGYGSAASITASNIAGGAAGSIPYQTASGATSLLAKGTDGQILTLASGLPSWAAAPVTGVTSASSPLSISSNAISLGTVPVSSGGTGATTLASNNVLLGNGTSALQVVAPGNSGNVLTSNGTTWSSTAPAALGVPYSGATGAVNLGSYELTANGVAVGRGASSKSNNYAYGYAVLSANTTGNYNNAFGHQALTANTTGLDNNAFGEYVLPKNIGGNYNTAMGSNALKENTSGSGNTAFGRQALQTNSTGSNNTALGHQANVSVDGLSNATAIGNGATVTASNTIQLGNSAVTNLKTNGTITAKDVTYPNTHNSTAGQVLTVNATGTASWAAPSGGSSSGGHYVGEVYGGGIVFYVTPGGYHGLIASSTDIMTSPILAIDRATSPDYHGYTTNNENLYTDWRAPTFSQLKLLREARNTAGLNLNLSSNVSYISSTTSSNDTFAFTCLRFVDNYIEYPNGNWTNDGRLVLRSIRTF